MAQVQRTLPAEVDLLQIWIYLASQNIEAADKVVQAIAQRCQDCAEFPGMGRRRDDLALASAVLSKAAT